MDKEIYEKYIENFEVNLLDCQFLGRGHNGVIYMLPEGKVVKICFDPSSCEKEYFILEKVNGNPYFPKVYGMVGNYMIRDFVDGIVLKDYIKEHGLSSDLAIKILELLETFEKLNFSKIDLRCKDIIVQPNGSLMVIDPKKFYSKERDFPRHLSKGLYKLGVLDTFMKTVRRERPQRYYQWYRKIRSYIRKIKK